MRLHFRSLSVSATSIIITRTSSTASGISLTTLSKIKSPPSINHPFRLFRVFGPKLMAENPNGKGSPTPVKFSRKVGRLQELMSSDPTSAWERCWEDGVTPWDLGRTTPVIEHLLQKDCLPKGRALVPGCGSGHDVVALACPERYVVGLDISDVALSRAKELSTSSPNANYISLLKEDFFTWHPTELFDLVFDYTFFCAIEINMRPAWAKRMAELIKPDGELITLMFPVDDHVGGPPYKTSVADYEMVLHPVGFQATSIVDNELAFGPRKGREKLGRWRKIAKRSSL